MNAHIARCFVATLCLLFCSIVSAATLSDIQVKNGKRQAMLTLTFDGEPQYALMTLDPQTMAFDFRQSGVVQGLPLSFSGSNLVKRIRAGQSPDAGYLRLIIDLTQPAKGKAVQRQQGLRYTVVITLDALQPPAPVSAPAVTSGSTRSPLFADKNVTAVTSQPVSPSVAARRPADKGLQQVVIAIDAGHGGQDPGAIGAGGTREKVVTLAVAQKLQRLLNNDPLFKGVMTRTGDYFVSVMGRSDVARQQHANMLVSIHADAAPNREVSGASVWVLSNSRADSEMAGWLEQHEKQSELLGGAGDVLANNHTDPYLSQAVLDLQFGHAQRVGYDVAQRVLDQLQKVGPLHKRRPEHASLGVLRSPDIPSLLVETGFISHREEEKKLASSAYQQQLAEAIYAGLRAYFLQNPLQSAPNNTGTVAPASQSGTVSGTR